MQNTLGERFKVAMAGPPKVSGRALAAACGVKPPSVSDWINGGTKTLEGSNLVAAAEFLNVRAKWLAEGIGPMRDTVDPKKATAPEVAYLPKQNADKLTLRLIELFSKLDAQGKKELLGHVEFFVAGRNPHPVGQSSALAREK